MQRHKGEAYISACAILNGECKGEDKVNYPGHVAIILKVLLKQLLVDAKKKNDDEYDFRGINVGERPRTFLESSTTLLTTWGGSAPMTRDMIGDRESARLMIVGGVRCGR